MGFVSALYPGEVYYDDANVPSAKDVAISGEIKGRGRIARDYTKHPLGSSRFAAKLDIPLIPRNEWAARIEEMEKTKSRLSDIATQAGLICKDQGSTSNCWANAPCYAMELMRVAQGLPIVYVSPAFIATKLGRYGGGFGLEAVEVLAEFGAPPTDLYPANANRKAITPEILQAAANYKIAEWWDIPDSTDSVMTCLLHRIPITAGFSWWSHEVTLVDPVVIGGNTFGVRLRNSWGMSFGTDGYSVLDADGKGRPDEAEAPRVSLPSLK